VPKPAKSTATYRDLVGKPGVTVTNTPITPEQQRAEFERERKRKKREREQRERERKRRAK
jgi:hypothetical protein